MPSTRDFFSRPAEKNEFRNEATQRYGLVHANRAGRLNCGETRAFPRRLINSNGIRWNVALVPRFGAKGEKYNGGRRGGGLKDNKLSGGAPVPCLARL